MNDTQSPPTAGEVLIVVILLMLFVFSCSAAPQAAPPDSPPGPSSIVPLLRQPSTLLPALRAPEDEWSRMQARPFDEAVSNSLESLLSLVEMPAPGAKQTLLVDPVIDGASGFHSMASRRIESRLADLVHRKYPYLSLQPFSPAQLEKSPVVLSGTLTAVNAAGYPAGKRDAYRICLALADLRSGTILSNEMVKAPLKSANHAPTRHFFESPAWVEEREFRFQAETCAASRPGDVLSAEYREEIASRAMINQAINFYEAGRYSQALESYTRAAAHSPGNLRILNGLYLTNHKLGRGAAAAAALAKIVRIAMAHNRFAMNFQFKPGSAHVTNGVYPTWLREIARQAAQSGRCMEITGHTSASGSETLNERLSQQRAESIKKALEADGSELIGRLVARGAGSRDNLAGTGSDDHSDFLDRRIVFSPIPCPRLETQTAHR